MTVSRRTMLKGGLAAGAAMAAPAVAREGTARTERWGVHELVFDGPAQGNPFVDVELAATFESSGRSIRVPGFYDGEGVYRIRFSRSEEHTSELQSLMRISYAVFCLKKKTLVTVRAEYQK